MEIRTDKVYLDLLEQISDTYTWCRVTAQLAELREVIGVQRKA